MTNGHNPAAGLVNAGGAPLIQDIKTQRVKLVILTQTFLASILALDGTQLLKCVGIPEDAECVGMAPPMKNARGELGVGLLYYHPSFPVTIPGRMPPMLTVTTEFYELVEEDDPSEAAIFGSPDVDDGPYE